MLRVCFVVFVFISCRIPAHAQATPQMEYGLSVSAQIEKQKKYPPGAIARHEIGQAFITFTIDSTGRLLDSKITRPSCFNELNEAALAAVRQAQPFSPFSSTIRQSRLTFTQPVVFAFTMQEALAVEAKADCNSPVRPARSRSKPSRAPLSPPSS
ncbi:energy transducer TonB [Bradyrhizobium sp. AZCC 1610]|uniref:energy transducer TonB n=1 Tax=Bradyrhizobium sp. AZCC 1610 TaxID=3117020 RepID=UPI003FA595B5